MYYQKNLFGKKKEKKETERKKKERNKKREKDEEVTYPFPQAGKCRDHLLLGNALQDPGSPVESPHAGGQGGDVQAQEEQEAHQGHLREREASSSLWVGY